MSKSTRHNKPKRRNDFDQVLRQASRQFASEIARVLLRTHLPIEPLEWMTRKVPFRVFEYTQTSPEAFEDLALAMAMLAEADQRKRGFRDLAKSLLPEELVMQSWMFKEGKAEGRKEGEAKGLRKGLQPLVHQFERRLGRPLTPDERARLAKRLRADGPDRVGDVVIDLSATELATWLAPSNGHGT